MAGGRPPRSKHMFDSAATSASVLAERPVNAVSACFPASGVKECRCRIFEALFEATDEDRVVMRIDPLLLEGHTGKTTLISSTLSNIKRKLRPEEFNQSLTLVTICISSSLASVSFLGKPSLEARLAIA